MEFDRYLSNERGRSAGHWAQSITSNFPAILYLLWGLDESTTGEKMAGWATSTGSLVHATKLEPGGRSTPENPLIQLVKAGASLCLVAATGTQVVRYVSPLCILQYICTYMHVL